MVDIFMSGFVVGASLISLIWKLVIPTVKLFKSTAKYEEIERTTREAAALYEITEGEVEK